jgi:hypothetical protein
MNDTNLEIIAAILAHAVISKNNSSPNTVANDPNNVAVTYFRVLEALNSAGSQYRQPSPK